MGTNLGSTGNNWQSLGAGALYGTNTALGGGGTFSRSELDSRRMGVARTPQAEYPDGYLGTINNRRGDRLLDSVKTSVNSRSYSRGVHVGTRVDPSDYFWPESLQPDRGLIAEASGQRPQLVGILAPITLVNDGKAPGAERTANGATTTIDPIRASKMQHLRPSWS
jgi:hypothetical protein